MNTADAATETIFRKYLFCSSRSTLFWNVFRRFMCPPNRNSRLQLEWPFELTNTCSPFRAAGGNLFVGGLKNVPRDSMFLLWIPCLRWPGTGSGSALRRWFKAPVTSVARVRISPLSQADNFDRPWVGSPFFFFKPITPTRVAFPETSFWFFRSTFLASEQTPIFQEHLLAIEQIF